MTGLRRNIRCLNSPSSLNQKSSNHSTAQHKGFRRKLSELAGAFSTVHYRLWEGLAVYNAIKRPHRPHAQIVYYITVGFPPQTKRSPHDLSVPLNTNSSVSSLTGSREWMMNCLRRKCRRPTQSDCWKVLSADMFTLKSRTSPLSRSKAADRWSLRGTEMPVRWTVRLTGSGWVGDWGAEMGRWWSVGMWLGDFTANALQAGELDPAGTTWSHLVSIRKL